MPGGRRIGGPDLQLLILALLAEQAAHGYELIRSLEQRSGGFYTPSPGMVYPALTYLEELEYAEVTPEGNRKLYAITDGGRAHLDEHRERVDDMLAMLGRIGERMNDVRAAYAGDESHDNDEIAAARHALKAALKGKRGANTAERQRIAEILQDAARRILGA